MRKIFTIHTDNGHGWLRVTVNEVITLGFNVTDFSWYSYKKNDDLYLEEDLDALRFVTAYERRYGFRPVFENEHYEGNSPIRNYRRLKERI